MKLIPFSSITLDANKDGILSFEDFELLSEKFTKLQRKGKIEKEPLERWRKIFKSWWNELSKRSDFNLVLSFLLLFSVTLSVDLNLASNYYWKI